MKLIRLVLVVAALASSTVSQSQAAGVVTNCDQTSLLSAMEGGGNVTFACDGTILLTNQIAISNNTVLDASGHSVTISGSNAVRICYISTNVHLALTNLTLTEGISTNGGAIWNDGGSLVASRCSFSNNTASGSIGGNLYYTNAYGGVIYNSGEAYFEDTTFFNNVARGSDGRLSCPPNDGRCSGFDAASSYGGAIYNSGTAAFARCTFLKNSAYGGIGPSGYYSGGRGGNACGGALFNLASMWLTNCTLTANSATGGDSGRGSSAITM